MATCALFELELESSDEEGGSECDSGRMLSLEEMCSSGGVQKMLEKVVLEIDDCDDAADEGAAPSPAMEVASSPAISRAADDGAPARGLSQARMAAPRHWRQPCPLLDASASELLHAFFECGWADGVAATHAASAGAS